MIDNYVKEKLKASIRIEAVAEHLDLHHKLNLKRVGGYLVGNCVAGHESKSGQCFRLALDEANSIALAVMSPLTPLNLSKGKRDLAMSTPANTSQKSSAAIC